MDTDRPSTLNHAEQSPALILVVLMMITAKITFHHCRDPFVYLHRPQLLLSQLAAGFPFLNLWRHKTPSR